MFYKFAFIVYNGYMSNAKKSMLVKSNLTGVAIPLGALKTKNSCGCGEYSDLIPFADFCKNAGLEIIQLLPVNDTGTESSPYSALSALALHPLYINIASLPECKDAIFNEKISLLCRAHNDKKRFDYRKLRTDKLELLHTIYKQFFSDPKEVLDLIKPWVAKNSWISTYAVFMVLKEDYNEASWKEWPDFTQVSQKDIEKRWKDESLQQRHCFYAWLQMRADEQFSAASAHCKKQGILLKGDLPIMMNEDSCDAWAFPQFFNTKLRAGAPPDDLNPVGQNWGFPTYNWENLKKDDYSWWKKRLEWAAQYYDVYRIDHVLGFFRIWSVPETECTAVNGWTEPFEPITQGDLERFGFNADRLRWFSLPHVPTRLIEEVNNGDYLGTHGQLAKLMTRIDNEELWVFNADIKGDKDIWAKEDIPHAIRERLAELWRDRMFIETAPGIFFPQWTYEDSSAWKSLNHGEQSAMAALIREKKATMETLWEQQARTLLGELVACTDMLACAEDLGSNPDCVPFVLENLNILGLRVVRWTRKWEIQGKPFVPFAEYPRLSVTTTSVHDSATLRLWWLNESDSQDFYHAAKQNNASCDKDLSRDTYNSETAAFLLGECAKSNSLYCIHPLQDFLNLSSQSADVHAEDELINKPGSVNEFNWTYRIPVFVEELILDTTLCSAIEKIAGLHKNMH